MNKLSFTYNGILFKTGDSITCTIERKKIYNAKIIIPTEERFRNNYMGNDAFDYENGDVGILICQNCKDGNNCNGLYNLFGYDYGWTCIVKTALGSITDDVSNLNLFFEGDHNDKQTTLSKNLIFETNKDNLSIVAQLAILEENKAFQAAVKE